MDKNIQLFITYLDQSIICIQDNLFKRIASRDVKQLLPEDDKDLLRITERKNMKRLVSVPREQWNLHGEIYVQFDYLSEMLEESPLNAKGKFAVIIRLLEKNLSTNITHQDAKCFDIQQIDNYEFKYMTRDEFLEFVRSDEYGRLKSKEDSELTEDEKNMLAEFDTYSTLFPLAVGPIIEAHKLIKEHYFDKLDNYDIEDVNIFLKCLKGFELSDSLVDLFRDLLIIEIEKRQKREQTISYSQVVQHPIEERPSLSKREYNCIERELRHYFDLKTMQVVSPLTLDIQIYCVGLLIRLGISEEKIVDILKIMNKDGYGYDNPITMFIALYDKLEYYKEVDGVRSAIETMLSAMQEIMIVNDDDYEVWKGFIGEELANALKLLPKTYDYEIDIAKKGSKK